jgi:hypothetical protein
VSALGWAVTLAGGAVALLCLGFLERLQAARKALVRAREALAAAGADPDARCVAEQRVRDRELTVARRRRWWRLGG